LVVTPVKTGVQGFYNRFNFLDSDFRSTSCRSTSSSFWGDSRRESDRKSLFKVGPLGFAELSKRLPLEADEPTVRNDKTRPSTNFYESIL
jgi:hypothetical protein